MMHTAPTSILKLMLGAIVVCCVCLPISIRAQKSGREPVFRSEDELMRTLLRWRRPVYPDAARAAGAGGPVVVELLIDEAGNVIKARPLSGDPLLQPEVARAALGWKFTPARVGGTPVRATGHFTYNYPDVVRRFDGKTIAQLELNVKNDPGSAQAEYDLGYAYFKSSQFPQAIEHLSRATAIDTKNATAYLKLGQTFMHTEDYPEAIQVLQQAIQIDPSLAEAFHALGIAYILTGQYKEAVVALRRGLEIEPVADSYFLLGKSYFKLERYADAAEAYRQGLAKHPDSDIGHFGLGEVYLTIEKFREAIAEFQAAIRYSDGPGISNTHYYLALAFLGNGDTRSAEKEYQLLRVLNAPLAEQLRIEIERASRPNKQSG